MSKQTNHGSTPRHHREPDPPRDRAVAGRTAFGFGRAPARRAWSDWTRWSTVGQTGSAHASRVRTQTERIASVAKDEIVLFPRPLPGVRALRIHGARWRRSARFTMIAGMLFGRRRG